MSDGNPQGDPPHRQPDAEAHSGYLVQNAEPAFVPDGHHGEPPADRQNHPEEGPRGPLNDGGGGPGNDADGGRQPAADNIPPQMEEPRFRNAGSTRDSFVLAAANILHDYAMARAPEVKVRILHRLLTSAPERCYRKSRVTAANADVPLAEDVAEAAVEQPENPIQGRQDPQPPITGEKLAAYRLARAAKCLDNNNTSAAMAAVESLPLISLTNEVKDQLRAVNLPSAGGVLIDVHALAAAKGTVQRIGAERLLAYTKAKVSVKKSDDIYGWTIQQVSKVLQKEGKEGIKPTAGLLKLLNDINSNNLPPEALDLLKRFKGIALPKPNGGTRPICMEPLFMKMAASLLVSTYEQEIKDQLGLWEHGFGVRGATEALTYTVRMRLAQHTDHVVIAVDMKNAFNSTPRSLVLDQVKLKLPQLYPLAVGQLGTPARVEYQGKGGHSSLVLQMEEGTVQGSPTGGVFFSLAFKSILDAVREEHPSAFMPHYYDDLYIIAPLADAAAAFRSLQAKLPVPLEINLNKCVLFAPDPATHESAEAEAGALSMPFEARGILVCKSPVGDPDYETQQVTERFNHVMELMPDIVQAATLPDSSTRVQAAMRVLRLCFGSKLVHLLRSSPSRAVLAQALSFDEATFNTAMHLIGQALPDLDTAYGRAIRERTLLPVSEGGLGLPSLGAIVHAAHVSSMALIAPRVSELNETSPEDFATLADSFGYSESRQSMVGKNVPLGDSPTALQLTQSPVTQLQKELTAKINKFRAEALLDGDLSYVAPGEPGHCPVTQFGRTALLHTRGSPIPGAFLTARPFARNARMTDTEFSDACKLYLGCPVREQRLETPACTHAACGVAVHTVPQHDLVCRSTKGVRTTRHHMLKHAVHSFLLRHKKLMAAKPELEPRLADFFRPTQGTVLHPQFRNTRLDEAVHLGDRVYLLDYVVSAPPLSTRDKGAAEQVALARETEKTEHYRARIPDRRVGNAHVCGLAFSAFGMPTPNGLETIRSVAKHLSNGSDTRYALILRSLCEVASTAIYKGASGILRAYKSVLEVPHQ